MLPSPVRRFVRRSACLLACWLVVAPAIAASPQGGQAAPAQQPSPMPAHPPHQAPAAPGSDSGGSHQHYAVAPEASRPSPTGALAPRLQNLGTHTFPVTTTSKDAQAFISQGLNLVVRVQPRRGRSRVSRGGAPRSGMRDGLLGPGARAGAEHQRADGPEGGARRPRTRAEGGGAEGRRHPARAGAHRRADQRYSGNAGGSDRPVIAPTPRR